MSLTGHSNDETRAGIIAKATDAAAKYYNTKCIGILLTNEKCEEENVRCGPELVRTTITYRADWRADIEHSWWQGSGGQECRNCKTRKP